MPAQKYAHINFTPPEDVQAAARRGLELRKKYGRGGLSNKEAAAQGIGSGVQRATNLANGDAVSPETIGRMVSFFARHEKNKDSKTESGEPGAGRIAWLLWGGDPGQRWVTKVKRQMEAADMKNKSLAVLAEQICIVRGQLDKGPLIQKIGARHTISECEMIQEMHDLALTLGAECRPMEHKAGARHSYSDQEMVQRIHDDCVGLGAVCQAVRDDLYHSQVMKEAEVEKGSAGSGNFGHDGRPGKLGGSSKGGGLKRIGAKKDSSPGDRKKAAKKFRDKRKGKDSKVSSVSKEALKDVNLNPSGSIGKFKPKTKPGTRERMDEIIASQLTQELQDRFVSPKQKDLQDKWESASKRGDNRAKRMYSKELGEVKRDDLRRALHMEDNIPVFSRSKGGARTENLRVDADTASTRKFFATKAQSDAPNYLPASTPQRCENCKAIRGDPGEDYCTRFDFATDPDYVCDAWQAGFPDEIPGYVKEKATLARLTEGVLKLRGSTS